MAYCPGCSKRDLAIQLLTDAWRLRNVSPAGLATSGLDYAIRNSPIPNTVEGAFEDAREYIENYESIFSQGSTSSIPARPSRGGNGSLGLAMPRVKKKRKVSRYQKEFGKQLKKLKKKHPRTSIGILMKKAHRATRKALK